MYLNAMYYLGPIAKNGGFSLPFKKLVSLLPFIFDERINVRFLSNGIASMWESVIILCFVLRYLMSILVLQSS